MMQAMWRDEAPPVKRERRLFASMWNRVVRKLALHRRFTSTFAQADPPSRNARSCAEDIPRKVHASSLIPAITNGNHGFPRQLPPAHPDLLRRGGRGRAAVPAARPERGAGLPRRRRRHRPVGPGPGGRSGDHRDRGRARGRAPPVHHRARAQAVPSLVDEAGHFRPRLRPAGRHGALPRRLRAMPIGFSPQASFVTGIAVALSATAIAPADAGRAQRPADALRPALLRDPAVPGPLGRSAPGASCRFWPPASRPSSSGSLPDRLSCCRRGRRGHRRRRADRPLRPQPVLPRSSPAAAPAR